MRKDLTFLYADYIKEREDMECLYDENGFATYMFIPDENIVYICDIYVVPEKRKSNIASTYADKIIDLAKKQNISRALGSVDKRANKAEQSVKVLEAYGFKYLKTDQNTGLDFYIRSI